MGFFSVLKVYANECLARRINWQLWRLFSLFNKLKTISNNCYRFDFFMCILNFLLMSSYHNIS